jgi:hypothetical protein
MTHANPKWVSLFCCASLFCAFLVLHATEKKRPLLAIHEVINNGFAGGSKERFLDVSQDGRIALRETFKPYFPKMGKGTTRRSPEVILSAAELQALREFLNGKAIAELSDAYENIDVVTDYSGSMDIVILASEESKRIALPGLLFGKKRNSEIYPVPIHDLVCKIYGLEQRVGVPYGRATRYDNAGHESDDTWCDERALELVPKPLR